MGSTTSKTCAMEKECAPSCANIFLGQLEARKIYAKIKDRSLSYLRYLDDIFMIWIGTHDELNIFTNKMNHIHPSIKFTFKQLQTEINLDTTIYKRDNS